MSRFPQLLDTRLTDGGEDISLTCRARFATQKHLMALISVRGRVDILGRSVAGRSRYVLRNDASTNNRTRDFPACSVESTKYATAGP
jgi:hypothetical protein